MIEEYVKSINLLEERIALLDSTKQNLAFSDYMLRRSLLLFELEDLYAVVNYLKGASPVLRLSTCGYNGERISTDYCNSMLL